MAYGGIYAILIGLLEPTFPVFNAVFSPIFEFLPFVTAAQASLGGLSMIIALFISVLYLVLIDQDKYDRVKARQEKLQEKYKEAQKDEDMEKANKFMKKSFEAQMEFMKISFKPIIASMLTFFVLMPWVIFTFSPVVELDQVQNGTYEGDFSFMDGTEDLGTVRLIENQNTTVIEHGEGSSELGGEIKIDDAGIWQVAGMNTDGETATARLAFSFVHLPFGLPLAGDALEWLGFYIIFQLPFTFIFRRLLGVN